MTQTRTEIEYERQMKEILTRNINNETRVFLSTSTGFMTKSAVYAFLFLVF